MADVQDIVEIRAQEGQDSLKYIEVNIKGLNNRPGLTLEKKKKKKSSHQSPWGQTTSRIAWWVTTQSEAAHGERCWHCTAAHICNSTTATHICETGALRVHFPFEL